MNILNYCSYIFNLETIIILSKLKFYKESFYINSDNQNITNEMLSELLINWRQTYKYDIDGIIVTDDK
jgi:hypothetical protein